jgi:hypothetical protein
VGQNMVTSSHLKNLRQTHHLYTVLKTIQQFYESTFLISDRRINFFSVYQVQFTSSISDGRNISFFSPSSKFKLQFKTVKIFVHFFTVSTYGKSASYHLICASFCLLNSATFHCVQNKHYKH